ncbi:hypothetical protein [Marinobacterium litorale]|uniref:hypothetical protein n=1 Tax=Marinobacterium litorale TaxID=404770 RepID=UPI000402A67A|nr:hypothetical protein [Marinobacterium litorale]
MTIRMTTPLRTARAQTIIDALDAAVTPGVFEQYSGGQPDPDVSVDSIPAHAVSTAYTTGQYVTAGLHYYRAENDGTSAGTAPTWPTNGGTVTDNDITWQDMGEIPVLLGTLTLSQPCGTVVTTPVSAGVTSVALEFSAWTEDSSADANGTATWGRFRDGDGNNVLDVSVGLEGSGAAFTINTTEIISGGPIRIKENTTPALTEPGA